MVFLGSINSWWNEMLDFQQALFIIAAMTTLFLVLQIILMLIGLGGEDNSFDADTSIDDVDIFNNEGISDMAGLRLISFRTVIAFLCMGSWMAFLCLYWMPWYFALPLGILVGVASAFAVAHIMRAMMKLEYSGNINLENAIGKIGDVYLTIPAGRTSSGKVSIVVQDSLIERDAVTDNEFPIKTGEKVRVIDVLNQGTLIVAPVSYKEQ